jgi:MATE family multidrug resistance protein
MAAVAAGFWWGGGAISSAITSNPAVVVAATLTFAVFAPMQLADAVQSVMLGALRGLSDTAYPATVSILGYWVLGLPLDWAIATWGGWGAPGIWLGYLVVLLGVAAILTARFLAKTGQPRLPSSAPLAAQG